MNILNIFIILLIAVAVGASIGAYFFGPVGAVAGGALVAIVLICLLVYVISKADFG